MKKILLPVSLVLSFTLAACGSHTQTDKPASTSPTASPVSSESARPVDLQGIWKRKNSMDADAYQEAIIDSETITINWVTNHGDTKSLYWVGSFEAPHAATDEYSWTSKRDRKTTDIAILASSDETKKFTFHKDEISFEAGILGTTTAVRLGK
ncbi:hypothetical protein OF385_07325 [Glutamicibacter sp. JL.03c]|uniref:hypothetical protein n=1 Tax=Glutamicibacter sp. JL.03c TaxID=2984842 RepID=UPI0021F70662|nr:hypothetical protein [Glutamicibacter sp. JL.03c]UYQ78940.1 hypothetical protein OF385_07325 [Glutamicibacter sp. JL.03c]